MLNIILTEYNVIMSDVLLMFLWLISYKPGPCSLCSLC